MGEETTYRRYSSDAMDNAYKRGFEQGFAHALQRMREESEKNQSLSLEEIINIVKDSNKESAS